MKPFHILLASVFYLVLFNSCKKNAEVKTQVTIPGTIFGDGNEHMIGEVIQTSDDQYLICGTVARGMNGLADGFLMKVDNGFNVLWYKNYGGDRQDNFESMAMDENENIMLAGYSYSFGVSLDTNNAQRNNLFYLVYTDNNGNIMWQKTYQPNDTSSIPNDRNEASKVIYLKNSKFCVAGITSNFNADQTLDGYAFEVNAQGVVQWGSNYFNVNQSSSYSDFEYMDNAGLCDDGNIMLLFKGLDSATNNNYAYLLKTSSLPGTNVPNRSIWQGSLIKDMGFTEFNVTERPWRIPLQMLSSDMCVMGDDIHGELVFTGSLGQLQKRVKFRHAFNQMQFKKTGNNFLVTGTFSSPKGIFPCWALADTGGNILEENYPDLDVSLQNKMEFKAMFINSKNERIAFGSIINGSDKKMVMLRFNSSGQFIQ